MKMMNDHSWWTRLGVEWLLCGPKKWLNIKVVAHKGCSDRPDAMIGQICYVSHHLGSLLGAIELIVLCASACSVGYFDAQIKDIVFCTK